MNKLWFNNFTDDLGKESDNQGKKIKAKGHVSVSDLLEFNTNDTKWELLNPKIIR